MSETATFTGEGFKPFPNTYSDNQHFLEHISNKEIVTDEMLENKLAEYYLFLERDDIMPRARLAADRLITHLNLELDDRYDKEMMQRLEDEVCHE